MNTPTLDYLATDPMFPQILYFVYSDETLKLVFKSICVS